MSKSPISYPKVRAPVHSELGRMNGENVWWVPLGLIGGVSSGKLTILTALKYFCTRLVKEQPEYLHMSNDEVVSYTTGSFGVGHEFRIDPSVWSNYLIDSYGIVYVVDSADELAINKTRRLLHDLMTDPRISGKPVLILANKQDLDAAMPPRVVEEELGLKELHVECKYRVIGCMGIMRPRNNPSVASTSGASTSMKGQQADVSKTYEHDPNIREGLIWLIDAVRDNYQQLKKKIVRDKMAQGVIDELQHFLSQRAVQRSMQLKDEIAIEIARIQELFRINENIKFERDQMEAMARYQLVKDLPKRIKGLQSKEKRDDIDQEVQSLFDQVESLKYSNGELKGDLFDTKAAFQDLRNKERQLRSEVSPVKAQNKQLERDLATVKAERDQLLKQSATVENELSRVKMQLDEARADQTLQRRRADDAEKKVTDLQELLSKDRAMLSKVKNANFLSKYELLESAYVQLATALLPSLNENGTPPQTCSTSGELPWDVRAVGSLVASYEAEETQIEHQKKALQDDVLTWLATARNEPAALADESQLASRHQQLLAAMKLGVRHAAVLRDLSRAQARLADAKTTSEAHQRLLQSILPAQDEASPSQDQNRPCNGKAARASASARRHDREELFRLLQAELNSRNERIHALENRLRAGGLVNEAEQEAQDRLKAKEQDLAQWQSLAMRLVL